MRVQEAETADRGPLGIHPSQVGYVIREGNPPKRSLCTVLPLKLTQDLLGSTAKSHRK